MIYHCIRFTLKPGVSQEDEVSGLAHMRSGGVPPSRCRAGQATAGRRRNR